MLGANRIEISEGLSERMARVNQAVAVYLFESGEVNKAIEYFNAIHKRYPANPTVLYYIGEYKRLNDDSKTALELFIKAEGLNPNKVIMNEIKTSKEIIEREQR